MMVNGFGKERGNYRLPSSPAPWSEHVLLKSVVYTLYADWNTDLINHFLPQSRIDRSIASHGAAVSFYTPPFFQTAQPTFRSRFPPGNWKASCRSSPSRFQARRRLWGPRREDRQGERFPSRGNSFRRAPGTGTRHSFLANFCSCRVSTEPCHWTSSGHVAPMSFFLFPLLTSRWNRNCDDLPWRGMLIFLCNEVTEEFEGGKIYWKIYRILSLIWEIKFS